ncbi:hypothetical protein Hanom_Chr12g01077731 [Helianthus anomalus]
MTWSFDHIDFILCSNCVNCQVVIVILLPLTELTFWWFFLASKKAGYPKRFDTEIVTCLKLVT